ncbi:MAG: hypothetical protein JWO82_1320 [Akkermansiaceae bacterium]|nr:hypothetical protein [Akkermansiaceae bacterium]
MKANPTMSGRATAALLPLGIFTAALGLTWLVARSGGSGTETRRQEAGATRLTVEETPPDAAMALERSVRQLLRTGDLAAVVAGLQAAAKENPMTFFKVLGRLPAEPALMEALGPLIAEAAARLPWADPQAIVTLNGMRGSGWRTKAWRAYEATQVGKRPDAEVYEVCRQATGGFSIGGPLAQDAFAKRPGEFLTLLLERDDQNGVLYGMSEMFSRHHDKMEEAWQALLRSGSPLQRSQLAGFRLASHPTAETLAQTYAETGIAMGSRQGMKWVQQVYGNIGTGDHTALLNLVAQEPAATRNGLGMQLAGGMFTGSPPGELVQMLGMMTSGTAQETLLEGWIKGHAGGGSSQDPFAADGSNSGPALDERWVAQLPTERLRARARELMGK